MLRNTTSKLNLGVLEHNLVLVRAGAAGCTEEYLLVSNRVEAAADAPQCDGGDCFFSLVSHSYLRGGWGVNIRAPLVAIHCWLTSLVWVLTIQMSVSHLLVLSSVAVGLEPGGAVRVEEVSGWFLGTIKGCLRYLTYLVEATTENR